MERKFNVGDRVRIIKRDSSRYGLVTTVTAVRTNATLLMGMSRTKVVVPVAYAVDLNPINPLATWCGYQPEYLEPIYDGNEKVSWSSCAWQPKSLRVC